jgi:hypothetical protein
MDVIEKDANGHCSSIETKGFARLDLPMTHVGGIMIEVPHELQSEFRVPIFLVDCRIPRFSVLVKIK